jgi:hypothetical protein
LYVEIGATGKGEQVDRNDLVRVQDDTISRWYHCGGKASEEE